MATGDLFRDRETGMIQRLVRDDGEKVYIADAGREAEMRPISAEDFEAQFEPLEELGDFRPAASSHSVSVEAARVMKATREQDEDEVEEAAADLMESTEASPSEVEETFIDGEPLDQTPENLEVTGDAGDPDQEFAPDLDAVAEDLPKASADEDDEDDTEQPQMLPETETNQEQE